MMREAVTIARGLFCDSQGDIFPITMWLDEDGDECAPESAVAAVAGTEGRWYALNLSDFGITNPA